MFCYPAYLLFTSFNS